MNKSTLGIFLSLGESFTSLGGQAELMLRQNILPYSRAFNQVYIFTYVKEKFALPANCHLITPSFPVHRYLYALMLPFIHYRVINQCHLLRCFQLSGTLPALICKLLYRKKFIFNYGYDYAALARIEGKPLQALGFKLLEKIASRLATGIIVKNKNLDINGYYLPNSVDTKLFKPKPKQLSKTPTVLYVGRLEPQKNLSCLLRAVALINKPLKVILIGQGNQKQILLSQAGQLGLDLTIKSPISHHNLPAIYQSADIFVLPSLIEGSPKVLLEAMATGLTIVGSNVSGIKEILSHNHTGLLIKPTPIHLSQAITKLLNDPQLAYQLGQAARKIAVNRYNQKVIIKQEINFFKSCIPSNPNQF